MKRWFILVIIILGCSAIINDNCLVSLDCPDSSYICINNKCVEKEDIVEEEPEDYEEPEDEVESYVDIDIDIIIEEADEKYENEDPYDDDYFFYEEIEEEVEEEVVVEEEEAVDDDDDDDNDDDDDDDDDDDFILTASDVSLETHYNLEKNKTKSFGPYIALPGKAIRILSGEYNGAAVVTLNDITIHEYETFIPIDEEIEFTVTTTATVDTESVGLQLEFISYVPESQGRVEKFEGPLMQGEFRVFGPFSVIGVIEAVLNPKEDVDMYLNINSKPTEDKYECRPYLNGYNPERCSIWITEKKNVYIGVKGITPDSSFELIVTY